METQTLLPNQPATTTRSITMTPHFPIRVFLVSGHQLLREALARALKNQAAILLVGAQESFDSSAQIIESTCDVLLVDPVNTRALDRQVLDHLQILLSNLRIVVIDMEATMADVISAIVAGSRTYSGLGHAEGPG